MDKDNKVHNFLKKINIDLGPYVLYDAGISKFLEWLADNITEENVLSDDELRDFYEMEQTESTCELQEILYGEDLKKSLEELNQKFPHLDTYTDDDVKMHENELEEVSNIEQSYETLLNDSKTLLNDTKKKNFQLNKTLIHINEQEERLNTECLQNLKEAQDIHNDIQKLYQEIESLCSCAQLSPCYMHQFPLEEFFTKCQEFNNYCDQYLRKSFEVVDSNVFDETESSSTDDKYTAEIEKIMQIINNSTVKLKTAEMELSSLKSVIKELENFNRISYDYQDMKHELEQTTQENKEMKLKITALKETLKKSIEKLNQQEVNRLIHDANSYKIQRAEQRLKDVQEIENVSHKFMILCELLWFSINFDTDMLNKYKNIIKEDTIEEQNHLNCLKRIEKLNVLLLEDPVANYTTEFGNEVAKRLSRSNFNQITLKEYDDLLTNIPLHLDAISNKSGYANINHMIHFLQENSNILIDLLDDGPLARPQIVSANTLNLIYNFNMRKADIFNKLKALKQTFKEEFKYKWATNKKWKYTNLLWIWFLTEPNRINEAIEDIKLEESKSRKFVSGILCKRN